MRKSSLLSVAALAVTLASPLALAQVYKWTDANGQVHYSDRAPSNATQIKGPTAPADAPPAPAAPRAPAAPNASAPPPPSPVTTTAEQAKQVERDVAAARAERCKQARDSYDKSIRAQHLYKTDDKGERQYLSDKDADAMRLQLKAAVDSNCTP